MRRLVILLILLLAVAGCAAVTPEQAVNYDQLDANVKALMPYAEAGVKAELDAATKANDTAKVKDLSGKLMLVKLTPTLSATIGEWFMKNTDKDKFDAEKQRRAGTASNGGK